MITFPRARPYRFRLAVGVILLAWMWALGGPVWAAEGLILSQDTRWQGEVALTRDVVIPAGVTLTVAAGAVITVSPLESTKIDPEFLSHLTEITVRGRLVVEGLARQPVRFVATAGSAPYAWAGILVDGGEVAMRHATIQQAEAGLTVLAGRARMTKVTVRANRYGVVASQRAATLTLTDSVVSGNEYGVLRLRGAALERHDVRVFDNSRKDFYDRETLGLVVDATPYVGADPPLRRSYGNATLAGETVWQGRVRLEGVVRVPVEARLVILPGTVVEFAKQDSNGDGIGENGLLVQGRILAKGTPQAPIIFRSAERKAAKGDWDAINVLGSDRQENLFEYCQIQDAYRGMHFHFSAVRLNETIFRENLRGLQFQESLVTVTNSQFVGNTSAVQARDSQVVFEDNLVAANGCGANFFRLDLTARHNRFLNNLGDGLRLREGEVVVEENVLGGNRTGMLVSDAVYGRFHNNHLVDNLETGLALRNVDNITVFGNSFDRNGINGVVARDARGVISHNLFIANGERGVGGHSFSGVVRDNNFVAQGRYGVGLEGPDDLDARANWWAGADLEQYIYDGADEQGLGMVHTAPVRENPVSFRWPLTTMSYDATWGGKVTVPATITVPRERALTILPGTENHFAADSGLEVFGRLLAQGRPESRILFTSLTETKPAAWGEVHLESAVGSLIENCDFQYATWGLHVHYIPMTIRRCRFVANDGGVRFRSGPMVITESLFTRNRIAMRAYLANAIIEKNTVTGNEIGIFVREKGGGLTIRHNNLYNNERYDIRVGDFNGQDVNARENWWGLEQRMDAIFDQRREEGIGRVLLEPRLTNRLELPLEVAP